MTGIVTGTNMSKTASVKVDRSWRHPIYKKIVTKSKTYLVHNGLKAAVGDEVVITETRPLSRLKRWIIVKKIDKAKGIKS